jgi:hypothetical protein
VSQRDVGKTFRLPGFLTANPDRPKRREVYWPFVPLGTENDQPSNRDASNICAGKVRMHSPNDNIASIHAVPAMCRSRNGNHPPSLASSLPADS